MECKICNKKLKVLQTHITSTHKEITPKQYYDLFLKGHDNKCTVCNKETEFIGITAGYKKLCKICNKKSLSMSFRIKNNLMDKKQYLLNNEKHSKRMKNIWNKREEDGIKNHFTPSSINFWINKGYSEGKAKKKVNEFLKTNLWNKNEYYRKNEPERFKNTIPSQIGYWIKRGYSEEDAKKEISERQRTFTLSKCIIKYGDIKGRRIFKQRQEKWQKTLQSRDDYNDIVARRIPGKVSKTSQKFFWDLYDKIPNKENRKFYFHELNNEFKFYKDPHVFLLDFFDEENGLCIEYNGNYWHENEYRKIYDKKRIKILSTYSIKVLTIWENDYNKFSEKQINKCLEFLKC